MVAKEPRCCDCFVLFCVTIKSNYILPNVCVEITGARLINSIESTSTHITIGSVVCDLIPAALSSSRIQCVTQACTPGTRSNLSVFVPGFGKAKILSASIHCSAKPEVLAVTPSTGTITSEITIYGVGLQYTSAVWIGHSKCLILYYQGTPQTLSGGPVTLLV